MRATSLGLSLLMCAAAGIGCRGDDGSDPPDLGSRDTAPLHDGIVVPDQGRLSDGRPASDGPRSPDRGQAKDQGLVKDQGAAKDTGPVVTSGPIVITEFLADPDAVADTSGEWVELYNPGTQAVDLKGWTLRDDGSESHVIGSTLVVPAKKYVVLGRSKTTSTNGGVNVDYAYSGFTLTNTSDEIELRDTKGTTVDRVAFGSKWFVFTKYSTVLKGLTLDNALKQSWCFGASAWSGSMGDYGTPGAANACPPNMAAVGCTHTAAATLSFSSHLCPKMIAQWKLITIRNGHDTSPKVGEWARLACSGYAFELEAEITVARHTTYGGITTQEILDDGFATQAEMMTALKQYYPTITLSSPATVFRWKTPALCNWP